MLVGSSKAVAEERALDLGVNGSHELGWITATTPWGSWSGAQAAWLGTRFLLADEMPIHADYQQRLIDAAETDPMRYPNLYSYGWPDSPHRALRNSTGDAWEAAGRPPLAQRPGVGDVIAHLASGEAIVRYEPAPPMAGTTGDIEALSMWAGQSVALARQTQPAADIVAELTSRL